ncbi:hypothetical protein OAE80_01845 [Planctomycetaceae bacterium]|nr:hypothetical protein [Planctomycetaceae bacterium]
MFSVRAHTLVDNISINSYTLSIKQFMFESRINCYETHPATIWYRISNHLDGCVSRCGWNCQELQLLIGCFELL